jgi:hypothetical protein
MSQWIYSINGQTKEPVSDLKIIDLVLKQELEINDYVMNPDDGIWKRIKDVPALIDKIHAPETAIPHDKNLDVEMQEYFDGTSSLLNLYFYIPLSRLIKMTILTGGIYLAYWWYKNWFCWTAKKGQRHRTMDRGIGWFMSPLMLFDKIQLDSDLNKVARADFDGKKLFTGLILYGFVLYAISLIVGNSVMFYSLIYMLGGIGTVMFFLPIQSYINRVNDKLGHKYARPGFGHYACLVLGGIFWISEIAYAVSHMLGIGS